MTIKDDLCKPFGDVSTRKGRGGIYSYIKWQNVSERMNEIFGIKWASEVMYQDIVEDTIIIRIRVTVRDEDTNIEYYQEGFGGAPNDSRLEAGNPYKSAYSKALKDACKKWGVGLFLEDDSEYTTIAPDGYTGKEHGVKPTVAPQMEMPDSVAMGQKASNPFEHTEKVDSIPIPPAPQSNDGGNSLPTPPPMMGSVPKNDVSSATSSMKKPETGKNSLPTPPPLGRPQQANNSSLPTPPPLGQTQSTDKAPSTWNKVDSIDNGGPTYISNVQKAALHSILSMKNVEYSSLVKEAFTNAGIDSTTLPEPDKLTYEQAVCIVKYGNDKFRKR